MFLATSVLMIALSAVLYLMVRALPRIVEEPPVEKRSILDRWAHSHFPEKVDHVLKGFLLKFLRKLKVFVLKIENGIGKRLERANLEDAAAAKKPNIDFKEMAGQNKEGEGESK